MIELTDEQARAVEGQKQGPLQVVNPRTQETFVLIRKDVYELVRSVIDTPNKNGWDDPEMDVYEQYRKP
jgi:hypothetical protein